MRTYPATTACGLDDRVAELLRSSAGGPPTSETPMATLRSNMELNKAAEPKLAEPVAEIRDVRIPADGRSVGVRLFLPKIAGPAPIVLFFHGGGWVMGSPETHADLARSVCSRTGEIVVSVDYRLAPEHPYPAPIDDGMVVMAWLDAHASEFGGDGARIAVMGDSAGGNIAAGLALRRRDEGLRQFAQQVLIYPATNDACETASYHLFASGYGLARDDMRFFWNNYLHDVDRSAQSYHSPLRTASLAGLPSTLVITAEFDPLRDDGEAYASRLTEAGVAARMTRYLGMNHGFVSRAGIFPQGSAAVQEIADALIGAFALVSVP